MRIFLTLLCFAAVLNARVTITPGKPPVLLSGGVIQFKANVPVTWSLAHGSVGTIDQDGAYHAPSSISVKNVLAGCQILANDHIFNTRIDALPLDPNSAAWVGLIPSSAVSYSPSWGTNISNRSTPKKPFHFLYTPQNDGEYETVPWPDLKEESGVFTSPHSEVDRHIVTVDRDTCDVFEIYNDYPAGTNPKCPACTAQSGFKYNGLSSKLPDGSVDAAGTLLVPMTLRLDEVRSGAIQHALRVTLKNNIIARQFVWPARTNAGAWGKIPYGARFRLKTNYDTSKFSKYAQVLLTQLKQYGLVLADGGGNFDVSVSTDVTEDSAVQAALDEVSRRGPRSSDFEVVSESPLMESPNLGAVKAENGYVPPDGDAVVIATNANNPADRTLVRVTLQGVTVGVPDPTEWIQSGVKTKFKGWVNGSSNSNKDVRWSMSPPLGTLEPDGTYTAPPVERPAYTVLTASSAADPKAHTTVGLTVLPQGPIRIDVGNATVAAGAPNRSAPDYGPDSEGHMWWRDQAGEVSWGVVNDDHNNNDWPKDKDIQLFYTSRYSFGDMLYRFIVPNGKYKITLLFAQNGQDNQKTYPKNFRAPIHLEAQGQIAVKNYDMGAGIGYARRTPVWESIPALVKDNNLYFCLRRVTPPGDNRPSPLLNGFSIALDPSPPHLTVDPPKVEDLKIDDKIQFAAVGWYMANSAIWSVVKGPGSISPTGLYTAPSAPPATEQEVIVQAKSTVDPAKVATANITFKFGDLAIDPPAASITRSLSQQFTASIGGAKYGSVNWTVNPPVGKITPDGTYTAPDSLPADAQLTVRADSKDVPGKSATAKLTVKAKPETLRINAGPLGAFKDAHGDVWAADYGFSPGTITWSLNVPVPNTTPDMYPLYHSSRYEYANDSFNYTFPLPNGRYRVTLKFSDYVFDVAGKHVFDVKINGREVLKNFDPNAVSVPKAAVDKTFETTVSNKSLRIDFVGHAGGAMINGLEIEYVGDH